MSDSEATFSSVDSDGNRHEIEMTRGQVHELAAGGAVAYFPRNERVALNSDGSVTFRESAVPEYRDAA